MRPMPNFAGRISAVAVSRPDRVAIEQLHGDGRVDATTYGQLDGLAGRIGAWLIAQGIAAGDRVAILADNDARWIAAYLGALRIGAVAVPLDTAYKAGQVRTVLDNSGARLLFTTPRYLATAQAGVAQASPSPGIVLLHGEAPNVADARVFDESRRVPAIADVPAGAAAVILYTSGTTADPKGVVLTHDNLDAEREGAFAVVHVTEDDAILGVLPLFHALAQMANLLLPLVVGARVVFLDTVSSSSLITALGSRGISIFACVPQFFYLIHQRVTSEVARKGAIAKGFLRGAITLNVWMRDRTGLNPGKVLFGRIHRTLGSRMRLFVTGGSKFDPGISRDLYGLGFTILNALRPHRDLRAARPSCGPAIGSTSRSASRFPERRSASSRRTRPRRTRPGKRTTTGRTMAKCSSAARSSCASTSSGRTRRASRCVTAGCYTGDLGRLDEQGRLYITGRKKEIIVLSSGKNLYPEEIEAHYRQSAFIKELCIMGLSRPDQPAAERLHAVVVPDDEVMRAKGVVNLRELLRFEIEGLSVQLPAHKRILTYDISLEPLPRTTTGKIRRFELQRRVREQAAAPAASDTLPESEAEAAWRAEGTHGEAPRDHRATARPRLGAARGESRARPRTRLDGTGRTAHDARARDRARAWRRTCAPRSSRCVNSWMRSRPRRPPTCAATGPKAPRARRPGPSCRGRRCSRRPATRRSRPTS